MTIITSDFRKHLASYLTNQTRDPLFFLGDATAVLGQLPADSIDFCMTSPPYWGKRQYHNGGMGLEDNYEDYISNLLSVVK